MSADGLCECGCGRPTPIAKRNDARFGHVKGQPVRYAPGHSADRRGKPVATVDRFARARDRFLKAALEYGSILAVERPEVIDDLRQDLEDLAAEEREHLLEAA